MYIGTVILGAVYVFSWVVGALGVAAGMALSIVYNHQYDFPICTLLHEETHRRAASLRPLLYRVA